MTIKLGTKVRDIISGFSGTAIQRLDQLNGNVQIAIQPQITEGATFYPEAMFIDHHMIEVMDGSFIVHLVTEPVETTIKVGEEVQDKINGLVGIATSKATYINGCVSFFVEPKLGHRDDQKTEGQWVDHNRLQVVSKGAVDIIKPVAPSDTTGKRPGGPTQRVQKRF